MKKLIGILGGTFDPIHNGHVGIAKSLFMHLPFKEIRFLPCYQAVHRQHAIATAEQRLDMLRIALKNYPHFVIDDCEINRKGPSYMIDTLLEMKIRLPDNPFALILGHDAWFKFSTWRHWKKILESCHIIIANRPHFPLPRQGELVDELNLRQVFNEKELLQKRAGFIYEYPDTNFNISATDIRRRIAKGGDLKKLLPSDVLSYIQKNELYQ